MSGIFGMIYRMENKDAIHKNIQKMLLWNRAYGRKSTELYSGDTFAVGCCYEKLSDKAVSGSPVIKKNNISAVIDALVYNHEELLDKYHLNDGLSDEELLFSLLYSAGTDALQDVNGDFCGALYDEREHTLTLFRDHMGIRPLFYYADYNLIAFSTDIRGLLALEDVDPSLNEEWIYRTCSGYNTDSLTATEYKNIFCINPASCMVFSFRKKDVGREEHFYWHLGNKKIRCSSFEEYKSRLAGLVTDSVQRRLNAVSGLVGAEFSGGLDSGVIGILIHRLGRECLYHSWSVDPNQLPYAEDDERLIIDDICRQENIVCHFSNMLSDYGMGCNIAKNMQSLGIPLDEKERPTFRYALPPYINTLDLCKTSEYMKRNGAKAIFTGHGGDEGISHRCNPYELFYHHEYYRFFKQIWSAAAGNKHRVIQFLKKCHWILGPIRRELTSPFHEPLCVAELLNPEFASLYKEKEISPLYFAYDPIKYIKAGGSRSRLDNIALQGAYNGIRYLAPYLDYRVIDFAVSIPRYLYLKGRKNRYLFREAFREIMPDSLYRLNSKEDNSAKNYPEDPGWYTRFSKKRNETYQKMNRGLWGKYLNLDFLDSWAKKGEPPSYEEGYHDESILACLSVFAMAENIVEKARRI